ncbi:MAG: Phosphate transport system regulatory protein PhoU [uncultured Gemmatimonadetes bacterium]|uniref:Phosphate-specific transport system accessory protein PhoU n=1 Tax=uncultured Gemmatimonadota bacterium TaxID=203437 RepID=A0A6J4MRV6_9BACT|nr:MAG: Phosphate transport system regulatory protein PhoU [uncultured Gemmatimonadota bacterium]
MSPTPGFRHFHDELAKLKNQLLDMSGLAEDLVTRSLQALRDRDGELAQEVIRRDNDLDAMEVAVDDACLHLLALQQPMARDLRLITMAMKISNDLERVGDHAVNIADAVRHLAEQPIYLEFPEIEEMGRLATEMLSDALDTFVRADPAGAREVCRRDDRVDALHNSLFRILLTHMMEDPRRIGASMSLFLVSRNLERIADLATNIAEDVVFLVEGRSIKHGAERSPDERRSGGERRAS